VVCIFLLKGPASAEDTLLLFKDIEVHGFASTSYNYNFENPATPTNGNSQNRVYDRDANTFKFDNGELVLVKETPKVGDVGFRTDLNFGSSYPGINASNGGAGTPTDDFDVQQGYVSYNAPIGSGLQIDMGKFATHIGAELMSGHDGWNYNHSRSHLFGFANPFVHAGVRAGYSINDDLSVLGMIANDPLGQEVDNNTGKALGAQIAYSGLNNVSIVLNWAGGNTAGNTNGNTVDLAWANFWDSVIDIELSDKTLLQLNIDYANQEGTSNYKAGDDAEWWGASGILRHDCSDWFSMNFRAEFFSDMHGTRTSLNTTYGGSAATTIDRGQKLFSFTVTPEFRISQNLLFRVEYRHDDSTAFAFMDGNNNQLNSSQDTIAANALFHF
jgi:hypothetical protein